MLYFLLVFSFCSVFEVVTSVATSPYPFCLVFVPRIASNGRRYNFGGVAAPRQILCCYQKNSCAQPERQKITKFNEHMPLVYPASEHAARWQGLLLLCLGLSGRTSARL